MNWKRIIPMLGLIISYTSFGQTNRSFTHADTLRGSITAGRFGWDVLHYDLAVSVNINDKEIAGSNEITYYESLPVRRMQIDLQTPMVIDSIINEAGFAVPFTNEGNAWWARFLPDDAMIKFLPGKRKVKIYFHGKPSEAKKAPWDGGFVWRTDYFGNPWVATAVQGLGASAWWPCKDHQSDEPDSGMNIRITAPDTLSAVSNGRLLKTFDVGNHSKTWLWQVKAPINNYDVTINIAKYASWIDTLQGEAGKLDLQYWVLDYNLEKAKKQFAQVKPMLRCFEHWFGKYPFYEDGYKLVETPFLGMEHQSAVAYGNKYVNGYLGVDRSRTGWGSLWDYIIVHESGHEWFGNNITTNDIADMWVHEGFTAYSEVLFTECQSGKEAAMEYLAGNFYRIGNDKPITGPLGVNKEGSGDMYYKGASLVQIIRNTMNNDEKFRSLLRGLNERFYHKTVSSKMVEDYIVAESGIDFSTVFDQYLRTNKQPVLEYYFLKNKLLFRCTNTVENFSLPVYLSTAGETVCLPITTQWKSISNKSLHLQASDMLSIEKKYYISTRQVSPATIK